MDPSKLFRDWLVAYMCKHEAIRITEKIINNQPWNDIEDMPLHPEFTKKLIINA